MSCYKPIPVWRGEDDVIIFSPLHYSDMDKPAFHVPCGRCMGCRLEYARQWAVRMSHEAMYHDDVLFVTLTYADNHLPVGNSLDKSHFTLFLKRLRKYLSPTKIRYFACGEYGSKFARPHYHMILFGHNFVDRKIYQYISDDVIYYQSDNLDEIWTYGFCIYSIVDKTDFDAFVYCAKYITKKIKGPEGDQYADHYAGRCPEYVVMSRKPGLGRRFVDDYVDDIYNHDRVVVRDKLICKPPRYYDKIIFEKDIKKELDIKSRREYKNYMKAKESPERLAMREEHARIIMERQLRKYEKGE